MRRGVSEHDEGAVIITNPMSGGMIRHAIGELSVASSLFLNLKN
jgi:hypothetical protein